MTSLSSLNETSGTMTGAEADWRATPLAEDAARNAHPRTPLIAAASAAGICAVIAAAGWLMASQGWLLGVVGLSGTTVLV